MKYDISALGNALVDTQYMVDHDFLDTIGLEADSMTLASAEEHAPIIKKHLTMYTRGALFINKNSNLCTHAVLEPQYVTYSPNRTGFLVLLPARVGLENPSRSSASLPLRDGAAPVFSTSSSRLCGATTLANG